MMDVVEGETLSPPSKLDQRLAGIGHKVRRCIRTSDKLVSKDYMRGRRSKFTTPAGLQYDWIDRWLQCQRT